MLDTTLRTHHHFAVYRQDMLGAAAVAAAPAIALLANTTTQTCQGFMALCTFVASAYGFLCVASMYELHMFLEDTTPRLGDSRALATMRQIVTALAVLMGIGALAIDLSNAPSSAVVGAIMAEGKIGVTGGFILLCSICFTCPRWYYEARLGKA